MSTSPEPVMLQARARVRMVVEIEVGQWAFDASMEQIFMQASKAAVSALRTTEDRYSPFEIIGEPVVEAIFTHKTR